MCKIRPRHTNVPACHSVTKNVESPGPLDYAISRSRLNQGRSLLQKWRSPSLIQCHLPCKNPRLESTCSHSTHHSTAPFRPHTCFAADDRLDGFSLYLVRLLLLPVFHTPAGRVSVLCTVREAWRTISRSRLWPPRKALQPSPRWCVHHHSQTIIPRSFAVCHGLSSAPLTRKIAHARGGSCVHTNVLGM
jgi:hypothetical protein